MKHIIKDFAVDFAVGALVLLALLSAFFCGLYVGDQAAKAEYIKQHQQLDR